jgi:aminotransferase
MAAIEALKSGHKSVEQMRKEYKRRRDFVVEGLNRIGLDCHRPQGAFYVFPSIAKTKLSSIEFANKLLKKEKVAVVPGTAFGPSGEEYIRIAYASSMDNMKEALSRIKHFLT